MMEIKALDQFETMDTETLALLKVVLAGAVSGEVSNV